MSGPARDFAQNAKLREASVEALGNANLQNALLKLKDHFQHRRADAFARMGNFEELREEGKQIKDNALANLDTLLTRFEARVTAKGGHVHWARNAEEARGVILDILKKAGARTVTKGKSMVSEEIHLNAHLEANGLIPVETDLGEYIIQLRKEPPSHIVAPAFHLNKEQVADTFREAHTQLPSERDLTSRPALVAEARRMLREKFEAADAGITGANFLSAEEGAAVIVTNEGNGDMTRLLPRVHIVLTGIEKVVPGMKDVAVLLRLLTRSATGQEISTYVSVMAGPRGPHETDGPEEFHVVLLDNGRTRLLGSEAEPVLRCIRCAACINHCPVYGAIGGHAYTSTYPGPIGAALNPELVGPSKNDHAAASSFCGRCAAVCPVKIPLPTIMRHWRERAFAAGEAPRARVMGLSLWAFAAKRPKLYRLGTSIAARVLKLAAGGRKNLRLPLPKGWFSVRDLPAPAGETFHARYRRMK